MLKNIVIYFIIFIKEICTAPLPDLYSEMLSVLASWWNFNVITNQYVLYQLAKLCTEIWNSHHSQAPHTHGTRQRIPVNSCSINQLLGWGRLWVGILKGRYINFDDWLIDWLSWWMCRVSASSCFGKVEWQQVRVFVDMMTMLTSCPSCWKITCWSSRPKE